MPLSKMYREIEEMIRRSLLHTKIARDIVRKSMIRAGGQVELESFGGLSLKGQYSQVDAGASSLGSVVAYRAEPEFAFPFDIFPDHDNYVGVSLLRHRGDWRGIDEVRLLATVTDAGPANSALSIELWRERNWGQPPLTFDPIEVPFVVSSPAVPLDEVGLHVSDWERIDWPPEANSPEGDVPALVQWHVNNPSSSTGSLGVGLCQLQARGGSE
jgi:hypothetical protein